MTKRRLLSLLPAYNQTVTLRKFFGASIDQLFQPGTADNISGYIGEPPAYTNPATDFYLPEPSVVRTYYQLEPGMVSYDPASSALTHSLVYPDLAAYLSTSGALAVNHQRMFETDSYTWAPPINIDMMVNFSRYAWFGDDALPTLVLEPNNAFFSGDGVANTFPLPPAPAGYSPTLANAYVEGLPAPFTLSGTTLILETTPRRNDQVFFSWIDDLYVLIEGSVTFDVTSVNQPRYGTGSSGESILLPAVPLLSSGMRIQLRDGRRIMAGFDVPPFDVRPFDDDPDMVTGDTFMVDGVGLSIRLTSSDDMIHGGLDAQYATIDRSSVDRNAWSLRNNWSHVDSFAWAGIDASARRAVRPIIEFVRDIKLFGGQAWQEQAEPLFMLYDILGVPLNDPSTYPAGDFAGSRILGFDFVEDAGVVDPLALLFDANDYILFQADISAIRAHVAPGGAAIPGLYLYGLQQSDGSVPARTGTRSMWTPVASPVQVPEAVAGLYPVAPGLRANPTSLDVAVASQSEWTEHFTTILAGQAGFTGAAYTSNNWRDSLRDTSLGTHILQHRAPLLRAMLLASDTAFDLPAAIRYADKEYQRFRNKFVRKITDLYNRGAIIPTDTAADYAPQGVLAALTLLKAPLNASFPFAQSTMGGGQFFIPPTPASMGIQRAVQPGLLVDASYPTPVTMIRGHDASLTPAFGDWRDDMLLALETMIFEGLEEQLQTREVRPALDLAAYVGNRFVGTPANGYSFGEAQAVIAPAFELWAQANGLDFRTMSGFDASDPFTWNFSSSQDRDGNLMPGCWRAIYRYYFDTDRPNTAPWEMLGFAEQPAWWTDTYGPAPYLRSNTALWADLEAGMVRDGVRLGVQARYARPGLSSVLPVDAAGGLLDPLACGIIPRSPTYNSATMPWQVGDGGPAETFWRNTPSFRFALAEAAFLLKPARFVEQCWDTLATGFVGEQWVSTASATFGERPQLATTYVHGETRTDGTVAVVAGVGQWIADRLVSTGTTSAAFGAAVRGLDVRLIHLVAGFVSTDAIKAVADSFGLVPAEDVRVAFYQSPAKDEEVYSGVIVEWNGQGWRVLGYDARDTAFTIIPPDTASAKGVISLSQAPEPVVYDWRPNTFYPVNSHCLYQASTYTCLRSHTSGATFEQDFWMADPGLNVTLAPRVTTYARGLPGTLQVPYGTVFTTYQEVGDFLLGWERWLVSRGWLFDGLDPDTSVVRNWSQAVLDFLGWTQVNWSAGNFIALSPGAKGLHFLGDSGTILNVEDSTTGFFGMLDRSGAPIPARNAVVSRLDGEIDLAAVQADIYCARLHIADLEHALVFSNVTIFDDIIYLPLYDMRQSRLKLIGSRSSQWAGRLDAPGYVVNGATLMPSFEKMADDIRLMFDIEQSDNETLRTYARHVVGYQERDYLNNLLLDDTEQFEFYQGQIAQKGTPGVFHKLLRSQRATDNSTIAFLEEWAIREARFGSNTTQRVTFQLLASTTVRDPQFVSFASLPAAVANAAPLYVGQGSTVANAVAVADPTWQEIAPQSALWLDPAPASGSFFPLVATARPPALPSAGYVRTCEVQYTAFNVATLADTYTAGLGVQSTVFNTGERIWVYEGVNATFSVLRAFDLGSVPNPVLKVVTITEDPTVVGTCRVFMTYPHGLTAADIGAALVVDGETSSNPELQGVQAITNVDPAGIWIEMGGSGILGSDLTGDGSFAPIVRVLRRVRFPTLAAVMASTLPFVDGDLVYVDAATGIAGAMSAPVPSTASGGAGATTLPSVTAGSLLIGGQTQNVFPATPPTVVPVLGQPGPTLATGAPGGPAPFPLANPAPQAAPASWAVYQCQGGVWTLLRTQPRRVDSARISETMLYDTATRFSQAADGNDTAEQNAPLVSTMTVFDPMAGLLPGLVLEEIDFQAVFDPANYDGSGPPWGSAQVGRVWWDLSTVKFLDPCTDDPTLSASPSASAATRALAETAYRTRTWGKVAPGSSVDIYEWVSSTLPPADYAAQGALDSAAETGAAVAAGTVYNTEAPLYVTEVVYDPVMRREQTLYFFWVSGLTGVPNVTFRHTAVSTVASGIANIAALDIAWMAPVSQSGLLVSGVAALLNDATTVLKVELAGEGVADEHSQWLLMRPYDPRSLPPDWLWRRLRDSLGGFDDALLPIPRLVHPARAVGIEPWQGMFAVAGKYGSRAGLLDARESFVQTVNRLFAAEAFVIDRAGQGTTLTRSSFIGSPATRIVDNAAVACGTLSWRLADKSFLVETPPASEYDPRYVVHDFDARDALLLHATFGDASTPINVLVDGRGDAVPNWSIWTYDPSRLSAVVQASAYPGLPADAILAQANTLFTLASAYDLTVAPETAAVPLPVPGDIGLAVGMKLLVQPAVGFWSIYQNVGKGVAGADAQGYLLKRVQAYDTSDFVMPTDWYANGYSAARPPVISYATETARDQAEGATPSNRFVRVALDRDLLGWIWTAFTSFVDEEGNTVLGWTEVARERGTYALSTGFFDPAATVFGLGAPTLDGVATRDGSAELRALVQTLAHGGLLTGLECNEVFFSALSFAHAQQDDVDWAFKTSFMTIAGYNVPLAQTPVQQVDETANLIAFVNEVKPYRVKLRDTSVQYTPDIDRVRIHPSDFDKPPYYDPALEDFRILDTHNANDVAILGTNAAYLDWTAQTTAALGGAAATSLVRSFRITVLFDRVADVASTDPCAQAIGHAVDNGEADSGTAAERIADDYKPGVGMPANNVAALLGTLFKGVRVNGRELVELDYPISEYDAGPCGFDTLPFDSELDLTITDGNDNPLPGGDVTALNPDEAGKVSGYGLADPYVNPGHPEERAVIGTDDALLITALDTQEDGTLAPSWLMSSTTQAMSRMAPLAGSRSGAWTMLDAWEWVRVSPRCAGTLAAALLPTDTTISVLASGGAGGDLLPTPDAASGRPGVVWVRGERIEYFTLVAFDGLVTLGQLRRGTRGTSPSATSVAQPAGTPVVNGLLVVESDANRVVLPLA